MIFCMAVVALSIVSTATCVHYWDWNNKDLQNMSFPSNFTFGVSIFDGEVKAYDHEKRYKDDIRLAQEAGVTELCIALDWREIEPSPGVFDEEKLHYYADKCVACLRCGIEPVILFKDYNDPIWFLEMGGFEKQKNSAIFERYCLRVFKALKGKAYRFITF